MKSRDVIKEFENTVMMKDPGLMKKIQVMAADAQMRIHDIHARAIACHCECLGMDAENSTEMAVCENGVPPFTNIHYREVLMKWGLTDEKGELLI